MIINICFTDYAAINVAEGFNHPVDYFDFGDAFVKAPLLANATYPLAKVSMVIFGGGGLAVNRDGLDYWQRVLRVVERVPPPVPVVIWGMGINDHDRFDRNYSSVLADLEQRPNVLIGLRDFFYPKYVPCVSCLRPEFDEAFKIEHDIVFYSHHATTLTASWPTLSNRVEGDPLTCFQRIIRFLGSAETVVTNTYHGAYWATLLNKKVVVVRPFSNKFFGFKNEPIIVGKLEMVPHFISLARNYPSALSESRRANIAFCEEVLMFRDKLR